MADKAKMDTKINDEIDRLKKEKSEIENPETIIDFSLKTHMDLELAFYEHLKKWDEEN